MSRGNEFEISTRHSADEAVSKIASKTRAISTCLAYALATSFGKDSQLVGEVSKSRVVLARARPLANSTSKPVFSGILTTTSEGTVLKGIFETNCFRKYFIGVSATILIVAEFFIVLSIFAPENQPLFKLENLVAISILPLLQIAAYTFSKFTRDKVFEDDKKWIEDELRRILVSS